ncbi:unnamed protein product [Clonostachys rosea f. rosea IK726]|uniref:Uncharacterized protein n=1 Tax=Clonostachys rosea f. rosea IK726 TaxID=1349383 RepID=A0ACA9UIF8_BIOOC|nr:unnamed protein product [Clonostachys rosea f. rosea IK726]
MEGTALGLGVAGLTFQFFHVGEMAYKILGEIRDVPKDAVDHQVSFILQRQRYESWAQAVGLDADHPTQFDDTHRDHLTVIATAIDILTHVCDLLTDVKPLVKVHGLKPLTKSRLDEDFSDLQRVQHANSVSIWDLNAGQDEKDRRPNNLMVVQQQLSWMRKIRWGLRDKSQFATLVKKLSTLNDGLRDILPSWARNTYDRYLLINQPADMNGLDMMAKDDTITARYATPAYALAANIKKSVAEQLRPPTSRAPLTTKPAHRINPVSITLPSSDEEPSTSRVVAMAGDDKVVIEFKDFRQTDLQAARRRENRIKALVALLQIKPKPSSYRILDCRGYITRSTKHSHGYGMVFDFPKNLKDEGNAKYDTLESMLAKPGEEELPVTFSLDSRFRLAAILAASVAELHAADWLHYNITSSNILCFSAEETRSLESAYLSGFEFDGYDDPKKISEPALHNTYRHPNYQLPLRSQTRYERSYDIYSVGIVLIEIFLWKQIGCFREEDMDANAFRLHLQEKVVPTIGFYMGKEYEQVVQFCLDTELLGVGADEGKSLTEAFSRKVVAVLERW